jgi:hypothetical protein
MTFPLRGAELWKRNTNPRSARTRGIRSKDVLRSVEQERTRQRLMRLNQERTLTPDPNLIGEHEVEPVRCQCCRSPIPWATIKGWRD